MTLGDIIKSYRKTYDLSMDDFSKKSGISKAYISLLEKNRHPKTGKPIAPSVQRIKQAADAMNVDFNVLFSMIDGDVKLKPQENKAIEKKNSQESLVIKEMSKMNQRGKNKLLDTAREMNCSPLYNDNFQEVLSAAHERTDIEVTEEMRLHDDAIMMDDSEWE